MAKKLTLGQASGGKPGKVAAKPAPRPAAPRQAAPMGPKPPPVAKLGLGLGLGPQQRANLQQAAAGQNPGYMQAHPQLANRINTQIQHGNPAMQQFFNSGGQSQRPGPRGAPGSDVMPQPPPAAPQAPLGNTGALQPQQPQGSMGMVGGNMQGQTSGGYGYQPQTSYQGPTGPNGEAPGTWGAMVGGNMGPGANPGGPWQAAPPMYGYGGGGQSQYGMAGGSMNPTQGGYNGGYATPRGGQRLGFGGGMDMGMAGGSMQQQPGMFGPGVSGQYNQNWNQPQGPQPQQSMVGMPTGPTQQGGGARYGSQMGQMGGQGPYGMAGGGYNPQNPLSNYPSFQQQKNPFQQNGGGQMSGGYGMAGGTAQAPGMSSSFTGIKGY